MSDTTTEPVEQLRDIHSYCPDCGWYEGESKTGQVVAEYVDDGSKFLDEVDTYDGVRTPCGCIWDVDDVDMTQINVKPWKCTQCSSYYADFSSAIGCCL